MNTKNNWIRDYLGVTAWHEAGYRGKHGLTANGEDFIGKGINAHECQTLQAFHEIAPDREVVYLKLSDTDTLLRETAAQGIDTMFVSLSANLNYKDGDRLDEELHERTTIFVSAGNDGADKSNKYMTAQRCYGVAAARLLSSELYQGIPIKGADITPMATGYSSVSDLIDFTGVTDLYVDNGHQFGGTSCACPVLCGMAALVNDFFIVHTGSPLTSEAMYRFLKDCSLDLEGNGRDSKNGWGLPLLPPPETIDIFKYQGEPMETYRYKDDENINPAHKDDVYRARELGLMAGHDNCFNPKGYLTREQAASLVVRLYDLIMKLFGLLKGDK